MTQVSDSSGGDDRFYLALALAIWLGLNLAVGKQYPWSFLPLHLGRLLWLALSFGLVALVALPRLQRGFVDRLAPVFAHRLWPPALVLANAGFGLLNYHHFAALGYQLPWLQLVACAAVLPWVRKDRLWLSVALSLVLLGLSIVYFPLNVARSDMLPVIRAAWDAWRSGASPYGTVMLPNGPNRMPYLPLTFLSHAGAALAGLDLRFNELVFRAAWMGWLARRAARLPVGSPWLGVATALVLSPYLNFRHDLYFEVFCLGLVAYAFAPWLRTALIPVLVATRQWAWVVAPFWLLERCRREGWGRALAVFAASSLGLALALVALFCRSTSLHELYEAVFVFQGRMSLASYAQDYGLTFAPILYSLHATAVAQPIQALVSAACLGLAWRSGSELRWATAAWVGFLLLNYHFWIYFWISPVVWLVASGIGALENEG